MLVTSICAALFMVTLPAVGRAEDGDSIRRKQLAQQRARAMTADLVAGVLDIQIEQLKENGLQDLPIYREVVGMRANLDNLVQTEMQEVVGLFVQAQSGDRAQRLKSYQLARGKVREIVVTLMAERRKLRRRLKAARLTAQAREIIRRQTELLETTVDLPQRKISERERRALDAVEDQGDVAAFYFELVESLTDVATWDGPLSEAASMGIALLRTANVKGELKSANDNLRSGRFADSEGNQKNVLKGVRALLELLERAQGRISRDREQAIAKVRELLDREEELREETRKEDLTSEQVDALVEQQTELHKEIGQLAESLEDAPTAQALLEEAKASALQAADDLFENKRDQAEDEQTQVIGSLAQLETELEQAIDESFSDKSAAELATEVKALEKIQDQLAKAAVTQSKAEQARKDSPEAAAKSEQSIAEQLEKAAQGEPLPKAIQHQTNEAARAAKQAEEALQEAAKKEAKSEAKEEAEAKVDQTSQQIQRPPLELGVA